MLIISYMLPKCVSGSEWIVMLCFDLNAGTNFFFFFSHQIKIRIWILFGFVFFFLIVEVDKTSVVAFKNKMTAQ